MLAEEVGQYTHDPAGFVRFAFPWGEGHLINQRPRKWLTELCERLSVKIRAKHHDPWRLVAEAVASGNGIGKSAAAAQLILWAMSTHPHTRGLVTANTGQQLFGRTWPELVKWHSICITGHWFDLGARSIFHREHPKTWCLDAVTWDEHNAQAFAGLHNRGRRQIIIFDEASEIPDVIWEKADLTMSDPKTELIWLVFGNPTYAGGRFRKCWTEHRHVWGTANIDSRSLGQEQEARAAHVAATYGEDSPQYMYGVRGEFIDGDACQLLATEWVQRMHDVDSGSDGSVPRLRVSVDVADGGEDDTVITVAQHYDARVRVLKQQAFSFRPALAVIESADAAERMFGEWGGDKSRDDIVVDSLGVGAGTAGTLMTRGYRVVRYVGGEASANPKLWRCRRVQSYMVLRDALRDGRLCAAQDAFGARHEVEAFMRQAASIRSKPGTDSREDLVTREEMRRNGIKSPDRVDSLAMQFATQAPTLYGESVAPQTYVVTSNIADGW